MNIMTICHADSWVNTHLKRFVYYCRLSMPNAKLYLVIPTTDSEDPKVLAKLYETGLHYFEQIRFIKKQEIPGRLLYYDLLRSSLLEIFNLDEGLYVDPDIDILSNLEQLTQTAKHADLLWVPNVFSMDLVPRALQRNNLDTTGPYMEPGFIYMRRSFLQDCEQTLNNKNIDFNGFAPGMEMWNIVLKTVQSYMLPQEYNVTSWGQQYFGIAHSIHFTGELPKRWRLHIRYSENPRRMIVEPAPIKYPDITFGVTCG